MREKIAVIGAGNVATHLAVALSSYFDISCIASRTKESAELLAAKVGASAINHLDELPSDCKMYLIAVNDDAIPSVVADTPDWPGIWAHTSGSVGIEVFEGRKSNYGVFYPLQTFSKNAEVEIGDVPMLIEGSSPPVQKELEAIASTISDRVEEADSARRESIHVAAVFACNFANLMWLEADNLLKDSKAGDISLFRPLLRQTLSKLEAMTPEEAMTGPARRGDTMVIAKHENRLPADLKEIYSLLSDRILKHYHTDLS